jgi:hypothetical protein
VTLSPQRAIFSAAGIGYWQLVIGLVGYMSQYHQLSRSLGSGAEVACGAKRVDKNFYDNTQEGSRTLILINKSQKV